MKITKLTASIVLSIGLCAGAVSAQTPDEIQRYPERVVKIIVPFSPGGGSDTVARLLAQKLSEQWTRPVIIENRAGANSAIGTSQVISANPDGYTLLFTNDATLVLNDLVTTNLSYKPEDLTPIGLVATTTYILVVRADGPKTVEELIALGRSKPGKLNYAAGIVATRLATFRFSKLAGIDAAFVQVRGSADVMQGLLDGTYDYAIDGAASYIPFLEDGKLRALATLMPTPLQSLASLRQLSTVEAVKDIGSVYSFQLVAGPPGLPPGLVRKISESINKAGGDPDYQKRLLAIGTVAEKVGPEELTKIVKSERARWAPIIRESGIAN